jgi:hypothetical protein
MTFSAHFHAPAFRHARHDRTDRREHSAAAAILVGLWLGATAACLAISQAFSPHP